MSVWTHVAGVIRYDDIRDLGTGLREKYEAALGHTCQYGDPRSNWDDCDAPCGSEGSLQWKLHENPVSNSCAAYVVEIWGDLRSYDDLNEIADWFGRCVGGKGFIVRQAVLHAYVEGGEERVWVADGPEVREIKCDGNATLI